MTLGSELSGVKMPATPRRTWRDGELTLAVISRTAEALKDSKDPGQRQLKRYGSLCHDLVPLIRRSGLSHVLGWLYGLRSAGDDRPNAEMALAVGLALCVRWDSTRLHDDPDAINPLSKTPDPLQLVETTITDLVNTNVIECMRSTRRALEFAEWFKAHAQIHLGIERPGNTGTPTEDDHAH